MKKIILSLIILLLFSTSFGQKRSDELQVLPFVRLDLYPEFTYNYGGRFTTDSLKMQGLSWGVNLNYKFALPQNINIVVGLGYYRYSFNKLKNINSLFGVSDARPVEVPSFFNILYYTTNYRYNSISLNIGIEKMFQLNKTLEFTGGFSLENYLSLRSTYKTDFNEFIYKKKEERLFAHSLVLNAGLEQEYGRLKLGPKLFIPVFDIWSKDEVFRENKEDNRSKWLNGIGIGFQINYPLTKK